MTKTESSPLVVVVFWCVDVYGKLLMQWRNGNHRDCRNCWSPGAGVVHSGESLHEAVDREVGEEYRADIKKVDALGYRECLFGNPHIAFDFICEVDPNQVRIGERDKVDKILWYSLGTIPQAPQLHPGCLQAFRQYPQFTFVAKRLGLT